jgi:hypothetical protein
VPQASANSGTAWSQLVPNAKRKIIKEAKLKLARLLFLFAALSAQCAWASEGDLHTEPGELGVYVGTVRAAQATVYRILDYCAQEFPGKREPFEGAKEQWDARNLHMANSVNEVTSNWFRSVGLPQESVPHLLATIEAFITAKSVPDKAVATLAALETVDRMTQCGSFAGFVIGGGFDVQRLVPQALEFFNKYSLPTP